MFQKIDQQRRKRQPGKRYKCLIPGCGSIISSRGYHLEMIHDFDRFRLRALEGDEQAELYFSSYFEESQEELSCKKKNYNASLTNKGLGL